MIRRVESIDYRERIIVLIIDNSSFRDFKMRRNRVIFNSNATLDRQSSGKNVLNQRRI